MKKKIIALVIIVLVLSSVFVGCTMFSLDKDRDYHQAVGTVSYKNMSDVVYKGELLTMVGTYGAMYVQYQGMTYEQVAEFFYNDLIKQKLSTMFAKEYVAKNGVGGIAVVADDAVIGKMTPKEFLTVDELRFCIEETNKSLRKSWQKLVDDLIAEDKANKGEEDKTPDKEEDATSLKARPVKKEDATEETAKYVDMGMTDVANLPKSFFEQMSAEIKAEKDPKSKQRMKSAVDTMNKNMKDSFSSFESIVDERCNARVVEKYEETVGKEVAGRITVENVANALKNKVGADSATYAEFDAYNTAMTGETQPFAYYHNTSGYFNVKSVLLKFSTEQSAALKMIQDRYASNKEYIKNYREKLALDSTFNAQFASSGLKVNVSNPNYDANKDELATAYTDKDVDYRVVLYAMAEDIFAKSNAVNEKIKVDPQYTDLQKKLIVEQAKKDAFTDWLYLANDDDGMFTKTNYAVTKEGKASSYVEEYTVLARELYNQNKNVGVMATGAGGVSHADLNGALAYAGTTDILKIANGKVGTITSELIEQDGDKGEKISTNVFTMTTANSNISFIVNDFGIHIVMIDSIPLNQNYLKTPILEDAKGGYAITGDYLYSSDVKITYTKDANGKKTSTIDKITITTKTVDEFLRESLKSSLLNDETLKKQNELFGNKELIKQNKHVYDNVIESVVKATK